MGVTEFSTLFIISFMVNALIIVTKPIHQKLTGDDVVGAQKFHEGTIPRVGGIGLFVALVCGYYLSAPSLLVAQILTSLTPIFIVGLLEDLFKSVSSTIRLFVSLASASLIIISTDYQFSSSDVFLIDVVFSSSVAWTVISVVALAALANGINIIDGFNGLAIGSSLSMAISIAVLGYVVNDYVVFQYCMILCAGLLGVLVLNFPKGLIFLGDAGAYTTGLLLGTLSMLLVERNGEITPLVLLIVFAYPMTELLFSIQRKTVRRGHRPDRPDKVHLHMLVYRRVGQMSSKSKVIRNSITGLLMNTLCFSGLLYILVVPITRSTALIYFLVFVFIYFRLYRKLTFQSRKYERT